MARGLTIGPIGSPYTLQANPIGFNYLLYSRALQQSAGAPGFTLGAGPIAFGYAPQAAGFNPPITLAASAVAFSLTAEPASMSYNTAPAASAKFVPGMYYGSINQNGSPAGTTYSASTHYVPGNITKGSGSAGYYCIANCINIQPGVTSGWQTYWVATMQGKAQNASEFPNVALSISSYPNIFVGYSPQYQWGFIQPTAAGQYPGFWAMVSDFNALQAASPGAYFVPQIAAYVNWRNTFSATAGSDCLPAYIYNGGSTYGNAPTGASGNGWLFSDYGYDSSNPTYYGYVNARLDNTNVLAQWIDMWNAVMNTSFVTLSGPYAGQTFTFNTHPLVSGYINFGPTDINTGNGNPTVPSGWSTANWQAAYQTQAAAFGVETGTVASNTYGAVMTGYGATGRPTTDQLAIIQTIQANQAANSGTDVFCAPPIWTASFDNLTYGQEYFRGYTTSNSGSTWSPGGTVYAGSTMEFAVMQPPDYNYGSSQPYTAAQVASILSQSYNVLKAQYVIIAGDDARYVGSWTGSNSYGSNGIMGAIGQVGAFPTANKTNPYQSSSLTVLTGALNATQGFPFVQALQVTGGTAPYTWTLVSQIGGNGAAVANGILTVGSPVGSGTVTVLATDVNGKTSGNVVIPFNVTADSGSLAITSPSSLPAGPSGGAYFYKIAVSGGRAPYYGHVGTYSQTAAGYTGASGTVWLMQSAADSLYLQAALAGSGTDTVPFTVIDSLGAVASATFSIPINSTLAIQGISLEQTVGVIPQGMVGNQYGASTYGPAHIAAGGTAPYTWAVLSGTLTPGLTLGSTGTYTGKPTTAGTWSWVVKVTDHVGATATATFTQTVVASQNVALPAWNTLPCFFQKSGQFYDPGGAPFRLRGADQAHYNDSGNPAAFTAARASAVRIGLYPDGNEGTSQLAAVNAYITANRFPIVGRFYDSAANPSTGGSSLNGPGGSPLRAGLGELLAEWIANKATWLGIQGNIGINIANEWGPSQSAVWLNAYKCVTAPITAMSATTLTYSGASPFNSTNIGLGYVWVTGGGVTPQLCPVTSFTSTTITGTFPTGFTGTVNGTVYAGGVGIMRGAGFYCPLFINAGNSGQDLSAFQNYAAQIAASDPYNNCVFDYHIYGCTTNIACPITSITTGASTTVHYTGPAWMSAGYSNNPFYTFEYSGDFQGKGVIYGAGGITAGNGTVGTLSSQAGTQPSWSASIAVASSGTYTSGGFVLDSYHYMLTVANLAALQSQGVCVCVCEFGPSCPPLGINVGSTTLVTSGQVIRACEANGIGWAAWAMDDGSTTSPSNNTYTLCLLAGTYTGTPSQLSYSGLETISNPTYGLAALATPASWFL